MVFSGGSFLYAMDTKKVEAKEINYIKKSINLSDEEMCKLIAGLVATKEQNKQQNFSKEYEKKAKL